MEEKVKVMQEIIRKLNEKREVIARKKETAATDAEEATREAHSGKEKLDAFIEYEWTLIVEAGFATTKGNPDLPFIGASVEYLQNVFLPASEHFTSQKDLLTVLKILKAFGGEQSVPFIVQLYQVQGVLSMTTSRSNGQTVEKMMDTLKMIIGYVKP